MSLATTPYQPNPKTDLILERNADVPVEMVWAAWTQPDQLKEWYCPRPWSVTECEIDLRPGGIFKTVMQSPEGEKYPHVGCYLEVVPQRKIVWTDALQPGFRPSTRPMLEPVGYFTAVILFEARGKGTKYTAIAMHKTEEGAKEHEKMGFHEGWGIVFDQLVEMVKKKMR